MGKNPRKDTVSEAITGAAMAVSHAFQSISLPLHCFESHGNATQHMSPGKMVELRTWNS